MFKIYSNGPSETDATQRASRTDEARASATSLGDRARERHNLDSVNLSPVSTDVARLAAKAAGSADVRIDRVNELRSAIQAGTFHPTGRAVADAIIRDEQ